MLARSRSHPPSKQEIGNVEKCLGGGFSQVALISLKKTLLAKVRTALSGRLSEADRERVFYLSPEELSSFLDSLPSPEPATPTLLVPKSPHTSSTQRGYQKASEAHQAKLPLPSDPRHIRSSYQTRLEMVAEALLHPPILLLHYAKLSGDCGDITKMGQNGEQPASVRDILTEVAIATAQATLLALKDRQLERLEIPYFSRTTTHYEGRDRSFLTSPVKRKIWGDMDIFGILMDLEGKPDFRFELCVEELAGLQRRAPEDARVDLRSFLQALISRVADEQSSACIKEMVERFLCQVSGGRLNWTGKVWLKGINLAEKRLEIHSGLSFRLPISSDFDAEYPAGSTGHEIPDIPDSILEASCTSCLRPDIRREINALSLFRLGAVTVIRADWTSSSVFYPNTEKERPSPPAVSPFLSYGLYQADAPALEAFLQELACELPINPLGHHEDSRWTGLKNYFRALHTASDVEERLGQAVASLEASLLSGEKGELRYRLSLRTASLLRWAGFNPREIFDDTRTAYDFRSSYAHGGEIGSKDLAKANDLVPRIMNYARLAVIKLIELPDKHERRRLLAWLDESLLDDKIKQDFDDRLRGGLWRYAL